MELQCLETASILGKQLAEHTVSLIITVRMYIAVVMYLQTFLAWYGVLFHSKVWKDFMLNFFLPGCNVHCYKSNKTVTTLFYLTYRLYLAY